MHTLLKASLERAMQALNNHAKRVKHVNMNMYDNVDESTFRSFLLAEIMRRERNAMCQTEWHRSDLLVQLGRAAALVEIKFYFTRRTYSLDGTGSGWKGGPGSKNEAEFEKCIDKLRHSDLPEITHKFLVLVYFCGTIKERGSRSYGSSYDDVRRFGLTTVKTIEHCDSQSVACKLIRVE